MNSRQDRFSSFPERPDLAARIHRWIVIFVITLMAIELGWILIEKQWLSAFLIAMIMGVIIASVLLGDLLPVKIPAEFQILAVLFAFATLFLGEFRSYYNRFWWWDFTLHACSGLLLGILGFLHVYVMNEIRRIDLHLQPSFVAWFAFLFAVAIGVIWEVLEFAMDSIIGTTTQKPKFGDPSGLTDTMWDLILDILGAGVISIYGWYYLRNPEQSFIDRWIQKFIARNPTHFRP